LEEMSKTRARSERSTATRAATSAAPSIATLREIADALCRAAHECYHQHHRSSHVLAKSSVDTEERGLAQLCSVCDDTLRNLAVAYETGAAGLQPNGADRAWWHSANQLWLASREFIRRHRSCDAQTRRLAGHHSARELEALHLESELDASALLALGHACADYRRTRPQVL